MNEYNASSQLPSPLGSAVGGFSSYSGLVRASSYNRQCFVTRKKSKQKRQQSFRSTGSWINDNVSERAFSDSDQSGVGWSSDEERREAELRAARQGHNRSAPRKRTASAQPTRKCFHFFERSDKTKARNGDKRERSRSAPPAPFSPRSRGPPWPQPMFRPAGPGPKYVRYPHARTRTFRPVHETLGYDARREAAWTRSPPWQSLLSSSAPRGDQSESRPVARREQSRVDDLESRLSDASSRSCGDCGCDDRCCAF